MGVVLYRVVQGDQVHFGPWSRWTNLHTYLREGRSRDIRLAPGGKSKSTWARQMQRRFETRMIEAFCVIRQCHLSLVDLPSPMVDWRFVVKMALESALAAVLSSTAAAVGIGSDYDFSVWERRTSGNKGLQLMSGISLAWSNRIKAWNKLILLLYCSYL